MVSGWSLLVWLECIGVVSGCCCEEAYYWKSATTTIIYEQTQVALH